MNRFQFRIFGDISKCLNQRAISFMCLCFQICCGDCCAGQLLMFTQNVCKISFVQRSTCTYKSVNRGNVYCNFRFNRNCEQTWSS